jgi:hypothetical protein
MDKRYKTEAAKWVAWGLGQITKEELLMLEPKELPRREPKREYKRTGRLPKDEMAKVLGRDMTGYEGNDREITTDAFLTNHYQPQDREINFRRLRKSGCFPAFGT